MKETFDVHAFAALFDRLDRTTSLNAKEVALAAYMEAEPASDVAWAVYLLTGRKVKRLVSSLLLRAWAGEEAGLAAWLFDECHHAVGDLAETIALVVDGGAGEAAEALALSEFMEREMLPLRGMDPVEQRERVVRLWRTLPRAQVFLMNKILLGGFRVGVSQGLVVKALARARAIDIHAATEALAGDWWPSAAFWEGVVQHAGTAAVDGAASAAGEDPAGRAVEPRRPRLYPFFLAAPLDGEPQDLGDPVEWSAEWKWDGIRGQLVRRGNEVLLWSRGEDLVTRSFPDIVDVALARLPSGTVLDGEILAFRDGKPLPFAALQRRLGRAAPSPKLQRDHPVTFMAYDLLEQEGEDLRARPFSERRARLEDLLVAGPFPVSPLVPFTRWEDLAALRAESRDRQVEGFILKRRASPYLTGRRRGHWWKWKIDPHTMDAVLVYAQAGHGRRASLYTDYTFAVWRDDELVPVAKAYSGLTDAEISEVDQWVRSHTKEKFGPVRAVTPDLVFELAFEAIAASSRHKSGVAVRFPRILRWRKDKPAAEADTLADLERLLARGTS